MTIQSATDEATAAFREAQQRVLDRYQVPAQSRFVDVPSIGGRAQVLVTGEGAHPRVPRHALITTIHHWRKSK